MEREHHRSIHGAGPLSPARRAESRWRRVFPGDERELSAVRKWIAALLPECPARDDVVSVATELGANAVRHTASGCGGWLAVEIAWYHQAVRVAVTDGGAPIGPRLIDDPDSEHGRGLLLVRGLSTRGGVVGDRRGRLVWADIPWDGTAIPPDADRHRSDIADDQTDLARRFGGIHAWFGQATLQWWALASDTTLISAASARELAAKLASRRASPLRNRGRRQQRRRPGDWHG